MNPDIERVRLEIEREVSFALSKVGLMYRIFSRSKSEASANQKLDKNDRRESGKKIQDIIGLRVVCYFRQDELIVETILKRIFEFDNESVTAPTSDTFSPRRNNFVFKIPESSRLSNLNSFIDNTFEVQIRTVFSEGWHEVEHDIRYKHQELWDDVNQNRELNSVYATLEMCDWGMERIMADMAYSGYRSNELMKMLTGKFMLRFISQQIPAPLESAISAKDIRKKIFKSDRNSVIIKISEMTTAFPITPQLLIYTCNHLHINDADITAATPQALLEALR